MSGPFETERQAMDAVTHITASPAGSWRDGTHRMLEDTCRAAGVQPGAYDHRILVWLANYEPWTAVVIAGLITRAHASPKLSERQRQDLAAVFEDAASWRLSRIPPHCPACDSDPAGVCGPHRAEWEAFDRADALARDLIGLGELPGRPGPQPWQRERET